MSFSIETTRNGSRVETKVVIKNGTGSVFKHTFLEIPMVDFISHSHRYLLVKFAMGVSVDSGKLVLFDLNELHIVFSIVPAWVPSFDYEFSSDDKHVLLKHDKGLVVYNRCGEVIYNRLVS
ncbi:hypothetical protein [Serratia sp. BIGb0163]|uniref:hypothetical protein n=1 Tax=Serratia sp. BIGb0163 TaxID=2940613 RepID=UPI002169F901|nr:hypothetical protein [Serratia sp. BIGb0163]MCS4265032.1 hypothetical protein [Serratia sp. BIGb0163]